MGYSIITAKNSSGLYVSMVRSNQGFVVHKTDPVADRGASYKAADDWRTENAAKNRAAKASKEQAGMTCQCCGNRFLANTGKMAHHGYQRPAAGWQTQSCSGARYLPFEVDRDRLGLLINGLRAWKATAIENRAAVQAETLGVSLSFPNLKADKGRYGKRPTKFVTVTRDTFEAVRAEDESSFRSHGFYDFDTVKRNDIARRDHGIERVTDEINAQQKRFDGWVQTHVWDATAEVWQPLPKRDG